MVVVAVLVAAKLVVVVVVDVVSYLQDDSQLINSSISAENEKA